MYYSSLNLFAGYDSYQDVLTAVRNGDTFAGILSSDVAAYMQKEISDDDHVVPLRIAYQLPIEIPISILNAKQVDLNFTICAKVNSKEIIENIIKKYRRPIKVCIVILYFIFWIL